jgi:molybdopterin converting factor small subunit
MASATVELPEMLAAILGGVRTVGVEGKTCRAALEDAFRKHPSLRVHVLDERGALRKHVLCFHNGENTRWTDTLDRPLADGDTITILQAVSGG